MTPDPEEIDLLLNDICKFLKRKKDNLVSLTPQEKQEAKNLLERSKEQLHVITSTARTNDEYYDIVDSKVSVSCSRESESYVDMSGNPVVDCPPPLPAKAVTELPPPPILVQLTPPEAPCPFKDLAAKQISPDNKHGTLSLRRKVFSIIDRSCKVYGAVVENWLLIYWSCKDAKPFCALDLKEYEAKEDESDLITNDTTAKKNSKIAPSFKVFSFNSENSSYSFTATTHKDMLHWVESINVRHDRAVRAAKNLAEQVYEICEDPIEAFAEENFYNEIDSKSYVTSKTARQENEERPLPELPAKPDFLTNKIPSIEGIYHEVSLTNNTTNDNADQTYYELATVRSEVKKLQTSLENDKENVNSENSRTEMCTKQSSLINLNKAWKSVKKNAIEISSRHSKTPFPPPSEPIVMENLDQLTRPQHSNAIVKIIRQRFSVVESPPRNLETFSRNSKLETFQASPPKDTLHSDLIFLGDGITDEYKLVTSVEPTSNQTMEDDEKPMVLLKSDVMEDEELSLSKKVKKSPTIPVKPKRIVKKLNY